MKIDEISIKLTGGISAESNAPSVFHEGADCSLVLRDFGSLGWPYNQTLKLYMPYAMADKARRIAAFINEVMAEDDSADKPLVEAFSQAAE